jgi:transposase-like protein
MFLTEDNTQQSQISQATFQDLLREKLRGAVRITLITVLEEEVEAFIGAGPYQRTPGRRDQRNGHYPRDLVTGMGKVEGLPVPRTRKGFRTQVFERYKRRQAELDEAISDMFVQGMSQVRVGEVFETLTGTQPSPSTVSRVFHTLEGEFQAWRERSLDEHYVYAFADGTYFSVIYNGAGHKMPILAVVGINEAGRRDVLGLTIGDRENQAAWEDLFDDLRRRGVKQVDLWTTDGGQAMINALLIKFPDSKRQRCIKHKMDNVLSYIPKQQHNRVKPELRAIFYQESREKADQEVAAFCEKYAPIYPTAIECLRRDLEACLTFYDFPESHWKTIRTTNVIDRLFGQVKKRSHKMAAAFRNEGSCLLMFYAVIRSLRFQNLRMPAPEPESAILHKI